MLRGAKKCASFTTKSTRLNVPSHDSSVFVLLFYVHGKQLWSRRNGQLTYPRFSQLDLLVRD